MGAQTTMKMKRKILKSPKIVAKSLHLTLLPHSAMLPLPLPNPRLQLPMFKPLLLPPLPPLPHLLPHLHPLLYQLQNKNNPSQNLNNHTPSPNLLLLRIPTWPTSLINVLNIMTRKVCGEEVENGY